MSPDRTWRVLCAAAAVLLLVANIAIWVERGFADETRFAETATAAMARDDVRRGLAEAIVREALADQPLLYRLARSGAERAVADLLATTAMETTLQVMATQLHLMLVSDERPTFVITSRLLQAIALAVALAAPIQAATLSFDGRTLQVELFARQDIPSYGTHLTVMRVGGVVAGVLALALMAASVLASANRARAVRRLGYALTATFVLTLLVIVPLRRVMVASIDDAAARAVVTGVYQELAWPLIGQTAVILVLGIVLWVVARPRSTSPAMAHAVTQPETRSE